MRPLLTPVLVIPFLACLSAPASADDGTPTDADRRAIARCLDKVAQQQADGETAERNDCIGTVSAPCLDKPENYTTVGQIDCASREASVWDEMLNKNYAELKKALDGKAFAAVREAQRKWIAFRDADCAVPQTMFEGGSIAGPISADCDLQLTARRANALADYLDWISN